MKNEIITTPVVVKEKALPIPSPGKDALPLKIVLKSLKSCRWWWGGELWKGGLITFDNRRPTLGDDKQDVKGSVCLATDYWISCVRWSKISNGQSTSILVIYNTLLGIQFYVEEGETGSWTLLGLRVKLSSCVSRPWLYADNQSLEGKALPPVKKSSRQSQTMEEPIIPITKTKASA